MKIPPQDDPYGKIILPAESRRSDNQLNSLEIAWNI